MKEIQWEMFCDFLLDNGLSFYKYMPTNRNMKVEDVIGRTYFLSGMLDIVWLTTIVSLRFGKAARVSHVGCYQSEKFNNCVILLYNQEYLSEKFAGCQDGRIYPMF